LLHTISLASLSYFLSVCHAFFFFSLILHFHVSPRFASSSAAVPLFLLRACRSMPACITPRLAATPVSSRLHEA